MRRTLVVGLVALSLAACGDEATAPPPAPDLAEARKFDGYRLFFTGRGGGDLPLVFVDQELNPYRPGDDPVGFMYGVSDCRGDEAGCSAPLTIENWPAERRTRAPAPGDSYCARGVRVRMSSGFALSLTTGRTVVTISGDGVRRVRRAVEELRSVDGKVGRDDLLPAPARSLRGRDGPPCPRTG